VRLTLADGAYIDCQWATVAGNMFLADEFWRYGHVSMFRRFYSIIPLVHFPDFHGPKATCYIRRATASRIQDVWAGDSEADGWVITSQPPIGRTTSKKQLKAQGGYVITHMGQIVREDGQHSPVSNSMTY